MGITPINLDITERLKDHAFAVEYVAAVEKRLAELESTIRDMVHAVPGGSSCDPQVVSDELRAIAFGAGVRVEE